MSPSFLALTPQRVLLLCVLLSVAGCKAAWRPPPLMPANPPIPAEALRLPSSAPAPASEKLDPPIIHRDLQHLAVALEEAYAGQRLVTPEYFRLILTDLAQAASEARTPAELCHEIAQHVSRLHQLKLRVMDASGAPCGPYRWLPPYKAIPPRGDEAPPWTMEMSSASGRPVALLTVNRIDKVDLEAGKRLKETLDTLPTPSALVIDLRSASGSTAEGGIWLARLLSGRPELWPVRGVSSKQNAFTQVLHLNAAAQGGSAEAPPWTQPPGAAAQGSVMPEAYAGDVRILTDRSCFEACVLTALALLSHPRAEVTGDFRVSWAQLAHPGLLVLPHSAIRIEIPTTVIDLGAVDVLNNRLMAGSPDPMETALYELRILLAERSRAARWKDQDPPPLCPESVPSRTLYELSPKEQGKLDYRGRHAELRPDERVNVLIWLSVDLQRARRLLEACPGVTSVSTGVQLPAGESILTITATWDTLLRLTASDVVVNIEGGGRFSLE